MKHKIKLFDKMFCFLGYHDYVKFPVETTKGKIFVKTCSWCYEGLEKEVKRFTQAEIDKEI